MSSIIHRLSNACYRLLVIACLFAPILVSAQEHTTLTADEGKSLWGLIQQGGWAMWPLGLCCLAVIYLTLFCWRETARRRFIPDDVIPDVRLLLQQRSVSDAATLLSANPSVLSCILLAGLEKARADLPNANKAKIESAAGEALEAEENNLGQWVNYLNVVAAVAPMIGLLGTVSGMIGAFQTISAGGMGRPELLAGDIGEALITTATGLVIGIPAMILYFILKNRLGNQMMATVQTASDLIDELSDEYAVATLEQV